MPGALSKLVASLHARWRDTITSLWFVPGATVVALGLLAFLVVEIDESLASRETTYGFAGDPSAARLILSSIAASLITVAGLALSLTVLTLQLVSSQFTPRALRGFMADRVTQLTAGLFVGVFAYCMLVLRTVQNEGETAERFVPGLGVSVAIGLSIFALAVLLFFIHHVATSIQASSLIARIARETLIAIHGLFPERGTELDEAAAGERARDDDVECFSLYPERPGYVQRIDMQALAQFDSRVRRIELDVSPGDFVTEATAVARVWREADGETAITARVAQEERIGAWGVAISDERDMNQDARYGIRQLVDIALRALSPGVNDSSTAATCIGYLRACLERLSVRSLPETYRSFADDRVIVKAVRLTYSSYVELAFLEIARSAAGNVRVSCELMDALHAVAVAAMHGPHPGRVADVQAVATHAAALTTGPAIHPQERNEIESRLSAIRNLESSTETDTDRGARVGRSGGFDDPRPD